MKIKLYLFAISLAVLSLIALPNSSSADSSIFTTVQIIAYKQYLNGSISIESAGSGTIISSTGDVLTNAHVVIDDILNKPFDAFAICVTEDEENLAECRFTATLKRYDESIDLATLTIDGAPSWGSKPSFFPFMPISGSINPKVTDKVSIKGFPSTGGGTITVTQGQVSGFMTINNYQYIKTDTDIDSGNSGGVMLDSKNRFIGVPTYLASNKENLGRALHVSEVAKWLGSSSGEKGSENSTATKKLRDSWKKFYQAQKDEKISFDTYPKPSATVPSGWDFLTISDSGFVLYKKNNGKAVISLEMSSNGFLLNMSAKQKLDILKKMSGDAYDNDEITKVSNYEAYHIWNETADGELHVLGFEVGYIEFIISYSVPKNDKTVVSKDVNEFLSKLQFAATSMDDPNPLQSLDISNYPYSLKVPSAWRIVLDYIGNNYLLYALANTTKLETAKFYYNDVPDGHKQITPKDGLEYDINNYLPKDAKVTFQSSDVKLDGLPGWIIYYEYKEGDVSVKEVNLTVLDNKYELYFEYSAETDIFDNGLQNFISTIKSIKTDTNGGTSTTYIPTSNTETSTTSTGLSDITGHRYKSSIESLVAINVIGGYPDGTFKPEKPVNRAEALKIILQGLRSTQSENDKNAFVMPKDFNKFSDMKSDAWFATYVAEGVDKGIINGYPDGTFKGENTVNLAEALKMTLQAYEIDVWQGESNPWYKKYFDAADAMNLLPKGLEDPEKLLTRAELAYIVDEVIKQKK